MADHWYHGINWTRAERVWDKIMECRKFIADNPEKKARIYFDGNEPCLTWVVTFKVTPRLYPTAAEYIACLTTDYAPKKQSAGTAVPIDLEIISGPAW